MTSPASRPVRRLFARPGHAERQALADALRAETLGGVLLLAGAVVAVLWASSPWNESYEALRGLTVGPSSLGLDLDLAHWAGDGLLAVFFFVAGLELKRELVAGDLREPAKAALPVVAALSGVVLPAALFLLVTVGHGEATRGWAIPTATDIAFALAVLAVLGSHLPSALRSFLLTLAVVDDLVAITIIAAFYTSDLRVWPLLAAVLPITVFAAVVRWRPGAFMLLVPLALLAWGLVHGSGVHATVAGVLLALTVPAHPGAGAAGSPAERLEHLVRPFSAAVAVPLFALFAAGVSLSAGGLRGALHDRAAVAVVLALVVGKAVGVFVGTWLTARFSRAELDDGLTWGDVLGVSLLAGIGFTVSLLIAELSFGAGSAREEHVKTAVLAGSVVASLLAAVVLRRRNALYRAVAAEEAAAARDH